MENWGNLSVSTTKRTYQLGDTTYYVPPLCLAQDEILLGILGEAGIADMELGEDLTLDLNDLLKRLAQKRLLRRFLGTILVPVNEKFDESKLPEMEKIAGQLDNLQILEIIEDFLSVNGKFFKLLNTFLADNTNGKGRVAASKPAMKN